MIFLMGLELLINNSNNGSEDLISLLLEKVDGELSQSKRIVLREFILRLFLALRHFRLLVAIIATGKLLVLGLDSVQGTNIDRIFAGKHELAFGNFLNDTGVAEYTPEGAIGRKTTALQTVEHSLLGKGTLSHLQASLDIVKRADALLGVERSFTHSH